MPFAFDGLAPAIPSSRPIICLVFSLGLVLGIGSCGRRLQQAHVISRPPPSRRESAHRLVHRPSQTGFALYGLFSCQRALRCGISVCATHGLPSLSSIPIALSPCGYCCGRISCLLLSRASHAPGGSPDPFLDSTPRRSQVKFHPSRVAPRISDAAPCF
jgi:hypothetical protein